MLQNSLTEHEVALFCEDFLKLLNAKKKHKGNVTCVGGDTNSGKDKPFHAHFGHHSSQQRSNNYQAKRVQ